MPKKKVDLAAEAQASAGGAQVEGDITFDDLLELAPSPAILKRLKATDDNGAKLTDLLYKYTNNELSKKRKEFNTMEEFAKKLSQYLLQELQYAELEGVTGKFGRIEVKEKEVASVEDWTKFYAHIKRMNAFDLLNKAVNQKAVKERWENKKQVPGVGVFNKKSLSLTKVSK